MSIRAMNWAWQQPTRCAGEKLVLIALADHAGEDGVCFPSSGRVGVKTGLSAGAVRRHIDHLTARGLVEKLERRRRKDGTLSTWEYRLAVDGCGQSGENSQRASGTSGTQCAPPARTSARAEPSERTVRYPPTPQRRRRESTASEIYAAVPLTPEQLAAKYGCEP